MKLKRIAALTGVVLIAIMYLVALGAAFSKSPHAQSWLTAAIFSTVVVPVMLYAIQLVYRLLKDRER